AAEMCAAHCLVSLFAALLTSLSRPSPRSPLFPYTTLFRSVDRRHPDGVEAAARAARHAALDTVDCDWLAFGHHQDDQAETVLFRSEEHTSELQSRENLVCRLLLEKKKHIPRHLPRRYMLET